MATSIVKKDEALVRLSRTSDDHGKVLIANLSEEDRQRCREITKGIKGTESLLAFGSDIASARNEATHQLLEMNKIDKAGKVGEYVKDVVDAIKATEYRDPDKLGGIRGFIAKWIPGGTSLVKKSDEVFVERFQTSKDVVDKIVVFLRDQQVDLKADYNTLDNMLEKTNIYIDQLGVHFVALHQLYADKEEEINKMRQENEANPGTYSDQEISEKQHFLEDIEQQAYELFLAGAYNKNVLVPSIIKMKDNALRLARNAEDITKNVIPSWEMSVSMALINKRAQEMANSQKLIKDKNNELIMANAEMLKNVTITLEQESRRGSIDVESYKKAYSTVTEALKESAMALKEAKAERERNMQEIAQINAENAKELGAIAEEVKKFYGTGESARVASPLK